MSDQSESVVMLTLHMNHMENRIRFIWGYVSKNMRGTCRAAYDMVSRSVACQIVMDSEYTRSKITHDLNHKMDLTLTRSCHEKFCPPEINYPRSKNF